VAFLDLDRAVCSDSAADLGLFIAHLERDALRGNISTSQVESLGNSLLEGYGFGVGLDIPSRIELYTAAGLLQLAPDPFRHREPNWPERTEATLDRVEGILNSVLKNHHKQSNTGLTYTAKKWDRALGVPVIDPFGVENDQKMPFLTKAINPIEVQHQFERHLPRLTGEKCQLLLSAISVRRYKPERRCLIEYEIELKRPNASTEAFTLLGKARARDTDKSTYHHLESLWNTGFRSDSKDGISVPEPIGIIPEFQMWLQREVPGTLATRLLQESGGVAITGRIAEAIHKLHQAGIPSHRRHTIGDELRILHERLSIVAQMKPQWANRLERILDACDRLGLSIPEPKFRGIHRDFYSDHVIVDGLRLYLLDFDLYCEGDPGLDIGNLLGHLTEQSLRSSGDPNALVDREEAIEERFIELSGEETRKAVRVYTLLTLVRHIYLSTQFPERRQFTEKILELCEQRLSTLEHTIAGKPVHTALRGGSI